MNPYIGEIRIFPYNFVPTGWMACDGQTMQIAENTPLFALLGTMFGGDGETTYCLPDFRDRAPVHRSQDNLLGQTGGGEMAQAGPDFTITPTLTATICIAIDGVFPQRS